MGILLAVLYATIVMGHNKKQTLTPQKTQLDILCCLLDDQFCISIPTDDKNIQTKYNNYCTDLNSYSSLTWEFSPFSKTVFFLDLNVTILLDGNLKFQTYQKPQNLYLYFPDHSDHQPGKLHGLIFGTL